MTSFPCVFFPPPSKINEIFVRGVLVCLTHSDEYEFSVFTQVSYPFMHSLVVTPHHLLLPTHLTYGLANSL